MKKFFLGIFLLCSFGVSAETIKGKVVNGNNEAMPFVTISVLNQDSTLVTGAITDDEGMYSVPIEDLKLKNEDLIIQASYIGYHTAYGGPDFVLREETEQLKELEVKAKKPLIERQMDKLVVNVSASPLSAFSLMLNYRGEKTYTFGQLTQVYSDNDIDFESYRETPLFKNYSYSHYDMNFQYYMLKVGNDWYIDSVNTFGFILQVPYMHVNQRIMPDGNSAYMIDKTLADTTNSITRSNNRMQSPQHTANLNYTHTFNEALERELTVNVDYNRYNNTSSNEQGTRYDKPYPGNTSLGLDIRSRQVVDIYSAKLDFQTKFWQTGMIECGVKYGLSSTNNSMTTDSTINDILQSQTVSNFIYDEHVAAAYISVGKQFGEHWSVKLGLRGEYTYSKGLWQQAQKDSLTSNSYFDPFPTAYVGYTSKPLGKLGQPIAVSASYTRRIKRPSYWMLNPFKTYVDAYSYQEGNTTLKPEFNNDVELHFSWTQYLNVTFNFAHTQDMFSSKMTIMPSGIGRSQWINFGTCTTHGANVSLTELPLVPKFDDEHKVNGAWLALTVNAGWLHFINKSYEKQADGKPVYENRNHYGYAGGTLSAYLPKGYP